MLDMEDIAKVVPVMKDERVLAVLKKADEEGIDVVCDEAVIKLSLELFAEQLVNCSENAVQFQSERKPDAE